MYVMFPVEWRFGDDPSDGFGGPPPDDAGAIYVVREHTEDWGEPAEDLAWPDVVLKTSLTKMILDSLDGWKTDDGYVYDDHAPLLDALAAALRKAADMLDAAKRPTSDAPKERTSILKGLSGVFSETGNGSYRLIFEFDNISHLDAGRDTLRNLIEGTSNGSA